MSSVGGGKEEVSDKLKAPFPYFGGKAAVADVVWRAFGMDVRHYIEPFFGSGAVLLARPLPFEGYETVNDKDGMVSNFWRALQHDPDGVARYADWPLNENDLHARHYWLVSHKESLQERLEGDPEFYDVKAAGWWVWGMSCWIGGNWCAGGGPWRSVDGRLVRVGGDGVNRKRPLLPTGAGIHAACHTGVGVKRCLPHISHPGSIITYGYGLSGEERVQALIARFRALADRLRDVRVCCGDWKRVCGCDSLLYDKSPTAIFLDPPYSTYHRDQSIYAVEMTTADEVREWAIAHGNDPRLRIALCGYEGEHKMPPTWRVYAWKANGGYGNHGNKRGKANCYRERIWFSPHCLPIEREEASFPLLEVAQ